MTHAQALADLRRQQTAWEDYRQGAARTARPAPTAVAAAAPARKPVAEPAPAPVAVAPQSRLELVAAGTEEGSGTRRGGGTTALKRELTVLQEDLDGRRREIAELQSRLAEAEALIQDLQRLIKLKDETLSALQQQALVAQAKAEEPVATGPVPVPAPMSSPALTWASSRDKSRAVDWFGWSGCPGGRASQCRLLPASTRGATMGTSASASSAAKACSSRICAALQRLGR